MINFIAPSKICSGLFQCNTFVAAKRNQFYNDNVVCSKIELHLRSLSHNLSQVGDAWSLLSDVVVVAQLVGLGWDGRVTQLLCVQHYSPTSGSTD